MKRETLNLVVSPDIVVNLGGPRPLWWMQATKARAKRRALDFRLGVADSIEQHRVKLNEPGGQNSLGVDLRTPSMTRNGKTERGRSWMVRDGDRHSDEAR